MLQEIIHNLSPIPTWIMFVIWYMYEKLKPDEQTIYVSRENIRINPISYKLTEKWLLSKVLSACIKDWPLRYFTDVLA